MEEQIVKEVESNMKLSINHLIDSLSKIRTGRANPSLVSNINVDYYGTQTPLQQLATINIPDPKLIVVQPFDKSSINEIEKSKWIDDLCKDIAKIHKKKKVIIVCSGAIALGSKTISNKKILQRLEFHNLPKIEEKN